MRFSIRDLFLVTLTVALGLGWVVDHRRAAARDAAWESCFQTALEKLSFHVQQEPLTFDTPSGPWRIHCTTGVDLPNGGE